MSNETNENMSTRCTLMVSYYSDIWWRENETQVVAFDRLTGSLW